MKKVGVSACFLYPDLSRKVFGAKTLTYLERDMSRYVARPDVMAILIPDLTDECLEPFLAELDGLVLAGGDDLAPETYGEEPIEDGRWRGDAYRDAYELKVLDHFIKNDKPILGICRGFQLMNAYFGGTLYQDIATQLPDANAHRDAQLYDQISHQVELLPDTWLADFYAEDPSRWVNTIHHQAIKQLGEGLQLMATSIPEGIPEAYTWEKAAPGKVLGVQWHPEFFWNFEGEHKLMNADRLYDHFLSFIK